MHETKVNGIKGVIFDLDGTLIDSFEAIMEGFNATLPHYGMNKLTLEESKALVGLPLRDTFVDLISDADADEATTIFRKKYRSVFLELTSPLPHASETIESLHKNGYNLTVATNKFGSYSRDIVRHLGYDNKISHVIGDGDGVKKKPEPDMLEALAKHMSMGLNEVVFVGDSPVDIATGKKAGVKTIAVPTGYHSKEMLNDAGAQIIIDNLSQLEGVISC